MTEVPENPFSKLREVFEQMFPVSQAAIAIYISQIVENILEISLTSKLTISSNTFYDRLFKGYGPLNTFTSKIDMARALEIVDEETYNTLRILKSIRYKVAHPAELELPNFDSPAIVEECQKLPGYIDEENCLKQFILVVASTIIIIDDSEAVKVMAEGLKEIYSE